MLGGQMKPEVNKADNTLVSFLVSGRVLKLCVDKLSWSQLMNNLLTDNLNKLLYMGILHDDPQGRKSIFYFTFFFNFWLQLSKIWIDFSSDLTPQTLVHAFIIIIF